MIPPVPPDSDWFPVRVSAVLAGPAYTFQEVWSIAGGVIADKVGGRTNTSNDPAYAIDGVTFAATAAGSAVQVLARRGPGAGGTTWELKGSPDAGAKWGAGAPSSIAQNITTSWTAIAGMTVTIAESGTYLLLCTINTSGQLSVAAGGRALVRLAVNGVGDGSVVALYLHTTNFTSNTVTFQYPRALVAGDVVTVETVTDSGSWTFLYTEYSMSLTTSEFLTAIKLGTVFDSP